MIGLDSFNIVVVGAFQVQELDYNDFEFHGQRVAERLRIPPVLQAGVAEYMIELVPGRFQVRAAAPKATAHRMQPIVAAAERFVDDYAGRRTIQLIGHNFAGNFAPGGGRSSEDFLADLVVLERFRVAAGEGAPLIRQTVGVIWQATPLARGTVQLEPLRSDTSKVFYNINFTIGADVVAGEQAPLLSTPPGEAIASLEALHELGSRFLETLIGGAR